MAMTLYVQKSKYLADINRVHIVKQITICRMPNCENIKFSLSCPPLPLCHRTLQYADLSQEPSMLEYHQVTK